MVHIMSTIGLKILKKSNLQAILICN